MSPIQKPQKSRPNFNSFKTLPKKPNKDTYSNLTLEDIRKKAESDTESFNSQNKISGVSDDIYVRENSMKMYGGEVRKLCQLCDVIIEVLDARDPLGSKCSELESIIHASGSSKYLILLLNKIDLIPRDVLKKWLTYLRQEYPTIAFKAATQKQRDQLGHSDIQICSSDSFQSSSAVGSSCVGSGILMKALRAIHQKRGGGLSLNVGVVGIPNVGKSSVINSLKRSKSCQVGNNPGVTKTLQEVKIDKKIKIMDSPGVVFPRNKDSGQLSISTLIGSCVKTQCLHDPIESVDAIIKLWPHDQLCEYFDVSSFENVDSFLLEISRRYGKIDKGGVPNLNAAAKYFLLKWASNDVFYYTEPPIRSSHEISSKIISNWKTDLCLNDIEADESFDFDKLGLTERFQHCMTISSDALKCTSKLQCSELSSQDSTRLVKSSKSTEIAMKKDNKVGNDCWQPRSKEWKIANLRKSYDSFEYKSRIKRISEKRSLKAEKRLTRQIFVDKSQRKPFDCDKSHEMDIE